MQLNSAQQLGAIQLYQDQIEIVFNSELLEQFKSLLEGNIFLFVGSAEIDSVPFFQLKNGPLTKNCFL